MQPARIRRLAALLATALFALGPATSAVYAAVLGDVEISHPSGTNTYGFEELLFADVADQVLGPLANQSPTAHNVATQGAFGESLLSIGSIGLAASAEVETIGTSGQPIYRSSARSEVRYDEMLSVTSATLPPGTPVDVGILYAVAGDLFSFHDLPPAVVSSLSSQQQAAAVVSVNILVDAAGPGGFEESSSYLSAGPGGTVLQTGAFAAPNGLVQLTVPTTVGSTVRLRIIANGTSQSRAQIYQPPLGQPPVSPLAIADSALGLAFGVEASLAGVEVVSPLLGTPFPDFSNATPANAMAMLPALPVPEPALVPALAVGVGMLANASRRPRPDRRTRSDAPADEATA